MSLKELEQFNKNTVRMNNVWECYRLFLKDGGHLNDTVAQFLTYLETTTWIDKDDFKFLA